MKIRIVVSLLCLGLAFASGNAFAAKAGKSCQWSDVSKMKEHFEKHVTYPMKGKAIKQACKKEMPMEFTKAERACVDKKIKNNTDYKSSAEVFKAIGAE